MRRRGDSTIWRVIPKDRDWAFSRIDGLIASVARVFMPRYTGFSDQLPAAKRLVVTNDYRRLNRLERSEFLDVVQEVRTALTDSVIEAAVKTIPPEYPRAERDQLIAGLKARRDQLADFGDQFYRAVARRVNIYGIEGSEDVVAFERISKERVRVTVRTGGAEAPIRYQRLLDGRDTRTVRLFIDVAEDRIEGNKDLPFDVGMVRDQDASK
jgi:hypothetical protein